MKKIFLLLILMALFTFCEKESNPDSEVEKYVQQLREGSYKSMYLPDYGREHIPDLLKYRNSEELIKDYPVNPLSSMYQPECTLGVFVLWTIESIRMKASGAEGIFAGYPSLNPIIKFRDPKNHDQAIPEDVRQAQKVAAEAYFTWWNSTLSFSKKKDIDPLAATPYSWW